MRYAPFLALLLTGCALGVDPGPNKFAGCYDNSCVDTPVRVPVVPALASLSAFTTHTCGLTAGGEAWCWGNNRTGALGDGTDQLRNEPVRVAGGLRFSRITVGGGFTCALALDGTVYCWGQSGTGQMGQAAPDRCDTSGISCAKSPLALPGRTFSDVAAGTRHVCGVEAGGAAYCWGFNFLGEVGSTAYGETVTTPNKVPGTNVFASIAAGDSFTCGLTTAARAFCWGSGDRGELGRTVGGCTTVAGFVNLCSATPVSVNTSSTFGALSVGNSHVCGLTPSGTALCWGDNGQGQLGTGTFENRVTPVIAQNGMTFTTINASGAATCGTPTSGPSVCWGLNLLGKLGIGTRQELTTTPLAIAGDRRYVSFAGGQQYVCGVTADGAAYCWGSGRDGQLGTGVMLP